MRVALLFLLLITGPASAQESFSSREADAVRARAKEQAVEAGQFAETIRRRLDEVRSEAEAVAQQARANRPQAASFEPVNASGLDFDRLVAQSAQLHEKPDERGPQLLAFVSFSLPDTVLRQIIKDVTLVGGAVVFRGMPENSLKAFSARLRTVIGTGEAPASIGIDPRLFRAFGVETAPTFIVVSTGFELCDGFACQSVPPPHDRMAGNVSVRHVLETVSSGHGPGAAVARVLTRRLDARGGQP